MLLGASGIATRSKNATRGSWHRYQEQECYFEAAGFTNVLSVLH